MKNITLLIVEDDPAVQESIKDLLELTFDLNIISCFDPRQALKVMRKTKVDFLLCDLNLPEMSGIELISAVRAEGFAMPILVCTAYADKDAAVQAIRLQVFELLEKPYSKDHLFEAIRKAIEMVRAGENYKMSKFDLSPQQKRILDLLIKNKSNLEICEELKLAEPTVKYHVGNVLRKFESSSRSELKQKINRIIGEREPSL